MAKCSIKVGLSLYIELFKYKHGWGKNIKFVDHDINKIIKALKEACFDKKYRNYVSKVKNPFGNGKTSQKIVKILSSINNDDKKWYIKNKLC